MFGTKYRTAIVVEEHVGSQRPLYLVSIDVLHWGFLFVLAFFTLFIIFRLGGLYFRSTQRS